MTDRKTVTGAYAKNDSHERECTLRYEALNASIRDFKDGGDPAGDRHHAVPDRVAERSMIDHG